MKPRRLSYYRLEDLSKQMHEAQACAAQEWRLGGRVRRCKAFARVL